MRKLKLTLFILAIPICMTVLTGCWDKRELQDLQIPSIAAYDTILENEKENPDDEFLTSIGWPIVSENTISKFYSVATPGYMVGETRGRRNTHVGEELALGQLQVVLFGDEFAKKYNIIEDMDILGRNPYVKGTVHMAVVKGRAIHVLQKKVPQYPNPAEYVKILLENIKKTNFFPETNMFECIRDVVSDYSAPQLPLIEIKKEDIVFAGSCLINDGKMAAQLGREETEIASMLRGEKCTGTLSFDVMDKGKKIDKVSIQGTNKRKIKISQEGEKYIIEITIILNGNIIEHPKFGPLQNGKDILKLSEQTLQNDLKKRAEAFVRKTKEKYKFDALCAGKHIQAHTRKKLDKKDIDKIIQEADIKINVKVSIESGLSRM